MSLWICSQENSTRTRDKREEGSQLSARAPFFFVDGGNIIINQTRLEKKKGSVRVCELIVGTPKVLCYNSPLNAKPTRNCKKLSFLFFRLFRERARILRGSFE